MDTDLMVGSVAETVQQKRGVIERHRLWCADAYRDGCPGHVIVDVLIKDGEVMSLQNTKDYSKCSVCERYIQTKFRYMLVAAVPPDVPHIPLSDLQQVLLNGGKRQ